MKAILPLNFSFMSTDVAIILIMGENIIAVRLSVKIVIVNVFIYLFVRCTGVQVDNTSQLIIITINSINSKLHVNGSKTV